MGAHLYNSVTGSFTSIDPVAGGNTTAYTYPQDPINKEDLDGNKWDWRKSAVGKKVVAGSKWLTNSKWGKRIEKACGFAWGAVGAVCGAAHVAQGNYGKAAGAVVSGLAGGIGARVAGKIIAKKYAPKISRKVYRAQKKATVRGSVERRNVRAKYVAHKIRHKVVKRVSTAALGNGANFGLAVYGAFR